MKKTSLHQALKRHHEMVADPLRTPILEQAVKKIVRSGDVVFDLGCGTGTMTLAALRAGARQVYACDVEEVLQVARSQVEQAGFSKRVQFFESLSSEIELPEKVDVILSETVGSLAFDENILAFLLDARQRFLKKGGRILPENLALFVAPCILKSRKKNILKGKILEHPFEIGAVAPADLLGTPQKIFEALFLKNRWIGFDEELEFKIRKAGKLSSFAGWFETRWAPGLSTRTSPEDTLTHWKQALLPVFNREVEAGDKIRFRLRLEPQGEALSPHSIIEWGCEKSD